MSEQKREEKQPNPCSACGDGDWRQEYHKHDYPPEQSAYNPANRFGPTSAGTDALVRLNAASLESKVQPEVRIKLDEYTGIVDLQSIHEIIALHNAGEIPESVKVVRVDKGRGSDRRRAALEALSRYNAADADTTQKVVKIMTRMMTQEEVSSFRDRFFHNFARLRAWVARLGRGKTSAVRNPPPK